MKFHGGVMRPELETAVGRFRDYRVDAMTRAATKKVKQ
jgi:hypothetical protein